MPAKNKKPQAKKSQQVKKKSKKSSALKRKEKKPAAKLPLKETSTEKASAKGFPVIGMGASAGGLEALEKFFSNMAPDSGAAFVLISHLSPDQKSLMPEILQKELIRVLKIGGTILFEVSSKEHLN